MAGVTALAGRLERIREQVREGRADALALAPSDNLRYALGFTPLADERACVLLVTPDAAAYVVPSLNAGQVAEHTPGVPIFAWRDQDGARGALEDAFASLGGAVPRTIAVDPEMRAETLLELLDVATGATPVSGAPLLRAVREVKQEDEIEALARAAATADRAMQRAFAACRPGVTELDVAAEIAAGFREAGADEVAFAIVAAGPHGAFPHHHAGSTELRAGDAVVIDLGSKLGGYSSDLTRMVHVGEPSARYRELHEVVERAVQAGLAAARPGATCTDVDRAARDSITADGYGDAFIHRTGHGLGLSTHEPPWIMAGEDVTLRPGMVFSIEPGVYLVGELGIRLEDIVHVTDTGCERFSALPRDVHVAPGT
jgi:Xaa-Pro aminopeptidase